MHVNAAASGFGLMSGLIIAIGAQNAFVLRQGIARKHVLLVVAFCSGCVAALISLGCAGFGSLVGRADAALGPLFVLAPRR